MNSNPAVSVVVPTRNRADRLKGLFDALTRQSLPVDRFELVLVDDRSTDSTPAVLESLVQAAGFTVTVLAGGGNGPAAARNVGWRHARAAMIAFTDDDCEPTPDWLKEGLRAAEANAGALIQGPTTPLPRERWRLGPFSRTKSIEALGPWYQTCNMFYPRQLLVRLGGFDERFGRPFGEDVDLAWRAFEGGARSVFAPKASVYHAVEDIGLHGYLLSALRDPDEARVFKAHPALRSQVARWKIFKSDNHAYLALALAGIALSGRRPAFILATTPYVRLLLARTRAHDATPAVAPAIVAFDALETYAAIRGALRHKVLAL